MPRTYLHLDHVSYAGFALHVPLDFLDYFFFHKLMYITVLFLDCAWCPMQKALAAAGVVLLLLFSLNDSS